MTETARPPIGTGSRVGPARLASLFLFLSLPIALVVITFVVAVDEGSTALDFGQFHHAAGAVLRGDDPYASSAGPDTPWGSPYPYPPLPALLAIPLAWLSLQAAGILVMVALVVVALAIPYVLGVRDWRCYGVTLLWPPVISAIQTGNLTLPLALAAAIVWRCRDDAFRSASVAGVALAAKFFLWPVSVWMAATRRANAAAASFAIGGALVILSWAVIGFAGFADYPALMRRLQEAVGNDAYTVYVVGLDLGLPSPAAYAIWLAVGVGLLVSVVVYGRRGDEKLAFALALAAALALSPIVWLHYFALLLVAVSLAQPRLGVAWLVPLLLVVVPGGGHPSAFETAWALAVVALTFALVARRLRAEVPAPRFEALTA